MSQVACERHTSTMQVLLTCLLCCALLLTFAGCSGASSSPAAIVGGTGSPSGSGGSGGSGGGGGTGGGGGGTGGGGGGGTPHIPTVKYFAIVVLENAGYTDAIGSASMPYLNGLIAQGSLVTNYYADTHPSIGNYFTLTTGTQVTNNDAFGGVVTTDNVARALGVSGKTWKLYAESIPSVGYLGGDQFPYLRRHNPFSYFSDVQNNTALQSNLVPFTQLSADLSAGALPNYIFVVPDAVDDAHNCVPSAPGCTEADKLKQADQFLSSKIAPLLGNADFMANGILAITFDEAQTSDATNGGGHIATLLLGSHVIVGHKSNSTTTFYDHRSLLSLAMKALSTNIPNGADTSAQMTEFFQ